MENRYEGTGLSDYEVDKLNNEVDYANGKAIKQAKTDRAVQRIKSHTNVIKFAPIIIIVLSVGTSIALWHTGQQNTATTLATGALTGVSGFAYGNSGNKETD